MLFKVVFVICKEVGTKPQYYHPGYPFVQQQPVPVLVQKDNCGWLGCVDQTIASIGSSVISGVNGTLLGIGDAAKGIANGNYCDLLILTLFLVTSPLWRVFEGFRADI